MGTAPELLQGHRFGSEPVFIELAYKLDLNEFRGQESVQLMIVHLQPGR